MAAMASGNFYKMHGLGNDFVIIDCLEMACFDTPHSFNSDKVRAISDRHTGIGCDQLILLTQSALADVKMTIFNADGGEVESCGNASRCVVALMGKDCTIETGGGIISGSLVNDGVIIDMGLPRFDWQDIPLAFAMDSSNLPLAWDELSHAMAVNVGNPHVVFFVHDNAIVDLKRLGPIIEKDAAFPKHINVNVADIKNGEINLRVWERGVGLTRACGTGACATAVAAIKQGLVQSPVIVNLPGGKLNIAWRPGEPITMTGGTSFVFNGTTEWDNFG
jgi:diaminopimelate epimerase